MSGRISLLDQCAKAIQDIPHAPTCNAALIGVGFPCNCYLQREAQFASGLYDAIRQAERQRLMSGMNLLDGFRRGAAKKVERRDG